MQNEVAFKRDATAVVMVSDDTIDRDRCANQSVDPVRVRLFREDGCVDYCAIAIQDEERPIWRSVLA